MELEQAIADVTERVMWRRPPETVDPVGIIRTVLRMRQAVMGEEGPTLSKWDALVMDRMQYEFRVTAEQCCSIHKPTDPRGVELAALRARLAAAGAGDGGAK